MVSEKPEGANARPCQPRARCRRWRTCKTCAGIRQAQIGDLAEQLAAAAGELEYSVLHPAASGSAAIADLRAAWVRKNRPSGAIWTIEQGQKPGSMHLNILHPAGCADPAGAAGYYREALRTPPRAVAAYISKPSGFPDQQIHPGRILGRSGPLWQYLLDHPDAPYVQAAALQHIIAPQSPRLVLDPPDDDPRAAAARWLPAFAALLEGDSGQVDSLAAERQDPRRSPIQPTPPPPGFVHPYERRHPLDNVPKTAAEAAQISRPHLANLRAILNQSKGKP